MTTPSHTELAARAKALAEEVPSNREPTAAFRHDVAEVLRQCADALESPTPPERVQGEATEFPHYELKFIMRVLGHEGSAPKEDWRTAYGMARDIFTRLHPALAPTPPTAPAQAPQAATAGAELTDTYVQTVPEKCDRITWRGRYLHLPLEPKGAPLSDEQKREMLNACGFVTGPNYETVTGRLYRSMGTPSNVWEANLFELIDQASAALRASTPAERVPLCEWTEEDPEEMPGTYRTACGELFAFTEGGLKENFAKFCQYCGGGIVTKESGT